MSLCVILHRIPTGKKAVSVAPASPGKHLAARLETPSDVHSLKIIRIMGTKNTFQNNANLEGWHRNTELGVDLKTIMHSARRMKTGKEYPGVLRRDEDAEMDDFSCRDAHYTFVETLPWMMKRNPRVYNGRYISITRQDNGTLHPNFKPMPSGMNVNRYAFEVYRELHVALEGLVEK